VPANLRMRVTLCMQPLSGPNIENMLAGFNVPLNVPQTMDNVQHDMTRIYEGVANHPSFVRTVQNSYSSC
jgi:hypothetical protein